MAYRYCDSCNKWLETSEHELTDSGQPICPKGHNFLYGFIDGSITTVETFNREHKFGDYSDERKAALRQNLIN